MPDVLSKVSSSQVKSTTIAKGNLKVGEIQLHPACRISALKWKMGEHPIKIAARSVINGKYTYTGVHIFKTRALRPGDSRSVKIMT